ncbi:MAG: 16S rRNA (guanine(966)-N(2))-methyltransferase RsmD [Gammaproteobacteria bacterium]|nr:16S rRNA (guanine(966)-N(2))-methyltransferase RsmD [Gammaproteobacteria bacterium]
MSARIGKPVRGQTSTDQGGQLRIIAGSWRGRKLSFLDREGLRPTTDRVRETLFNWLQMELPGSHCLDLFAGSGALGFEAASRGAEKVVMVDSDSQSVKMLCSNVELLSAPQIEVVGSDAITFLQRCKSHREPDRNSERAFDIIFIDPPYGSDVIATCCALLESEQCLAVHAKIYVECDAGNDLSKAENGLPGNWRCLKHKTAGQVGYHLFVRD